MRGFVFAVLGFVKRRHGSFSLVRCGPPLAALMARLDAGNAGGACTRGAERARAGAKRRTARAGKFVSRGMRRRVDSLLSPAGAKRSGAPFGAGEIFPPLPLRPASVSGFLATLKGARAADQDTGESLKRCCREQGRRPASYRNGAAPVSLRNGSAPLHPAARATPASRHRAAAP